MAAELHDYSTHLETVDRFADVRDLIPAQPDGETWLPDDGILAASSLRLEELENYVLDPILNRSVTGLGQVCLKSVRHSGGKHPGQDIRTHRLYAIEHKGYRHAVEVTDPVASEPDFMVISFPGFTETIEGGIRRKMHTRLSYEFPQARIVSVGSNGIGSTGDRYGWNERSLHGIDAMGSQRLAMAEALAGNMPVIGKGTSMGTVVLHRMALENLRRTPEDRVNIAGLYWLSPALVDPKNIRKDMALRFLPQLTADAMKELALKTPPREVLHIARTAVKYGLSRDDLVAMRHQMWELFRGTKEEEIGEVLEQTPTLVVAGENDCLAQWPMMQRLQHQYDGHLFLEMIEGRGHSLAMKPDKACGKLAKAGQFLAQRALQGSLL